MTEDSNHSVVEQLHDFVNSGEYLTTLWLDLFLSSHPKFHLGLSIFNPYRIATNQILGVKFIWVITLKLSFPACVMLSGRVNLRSEIKFVLRRS